MQEDKTIRKWRDEQKWIQSRKSRFPLDMSKAIQEAKWPHIKLKYNYEAIREVIDEHYPEARGCEIKDQQRFIGFVLHDRLKKALHRRTQDYVISFNRVKNGRSASCGFVIGFTDTATAVMARMLTSFDDATSYEYFDPEEGQ
jgi:hypothetical protein